MQPIDLEAIRIGFDPWNDRRYIVLRTQQAEGIQSMLYITGPLSMLNLLYLRLSCQEAVQYKKPLSSMSAHLDVHTL